MLATGKGQICEILRGKRSPCKPVATLALFNHPEARKRPQNARTNNRLLAEVWYCERYCIGKKRIVRYASAVSRKLAKDVITITPRDRPIYEMCQQRPSKRESQRGSGGPPLLAEITGEEKCCCARL